MKFWTVSRWFPCLFSNQTLDIPNINSLKLYTQSQNFVQKTSYNLQFSIAYLNNSDKDARTFFKTYNNEILFSRNLNFLKPNSTFNLNHSMYFSRVKKFLSFLNYSEGNAIYVTISAQLAIYSSNVFYFIITQSHVSMKWENGKTWLGVH